MPGEYEDRKRLTFEQGEGAEPLPSQLALKEISPDLRIRLWEKLGNSISDQDYHNNWMVILRRKHIYRDLRPHDEFVQVSRSASTEVKQLIRNGNYLQVFGLLQWMVRPPEFPQRFH